MLLAGCGSGDDWSAPHPKPSAVGRLGPGFMPATTPAPEATVTPRPGSWDDVHPSEGYRVVLLTAGKDKPTRTLVTAVETWGHDEGVSLKVVKATRPTRFIPSIQKAMALSPDLIISAGNDLVDPLTTVTASHLDRTFLIIGAELAEPTENVTAADWTGASFRGEGLGASSTYDPASFTPDRADRAIRAGVAAVLHDQTGIVLWID